VVVSEEPEPGVCRCGWNEPRGIGVHALIDDVLKKVLADVEGAQCVLLASLDGMVVASAVAVDGPAPDVVAASLADLFRRVGVAHRDAGFARPKEFTSGGASVQSVLRMVTPQYLLVAVLDGIGSLGRTRFALRRAAAALEPELT
jgi:predicted regulator of Ras-like GTPase activity (Roadblock/LC7/MglB family)